MRRSAGRYRLYTPVRRARLSSPPGTPHPSPPGLLSMGRSTGVLEASHGRNNGAWPLLQSLRVPAPSSFYIRRTLIRLLSSCFLDGKQVPSVNAIFFDGDRVEGTGNLVIERLSDSRNIVKLLVSKLGGSANVCLVDVSTFKGPFAAYKEFILSVNSRGEPKRYDSDGFPASSSIDLI